MGKLRSSFKFARWIVTIGVLLHTHPAFAFGGGLDGITTKVDEVNSWLITFGSVFAVTGFIWAVLAFMGRLGGFAQAVTTLFAGLAVANAKQIVSFFIS